MAGSYLHCVTDSGRLRSRKSLANMLENGGDVHEAVEELYGMVWWLAHELAAAQQGRRLTSAPPELTRQNVEAARQRYRDGLQIAPGDD